MEKIRESIDPEKWAEVFGEPAEFVNVEEIASVLVKPNLPYAVLVALKEAQNKIGP